MKSKIKFLLNEKESLYFSFIEILSCIVTCASSSLFFFFLLLLFNQSNMLFVIDLFTDEHRSMFSIVDGFKENANKLHTND